MPRHRRSPAAFVGGITLAAAGGLATSVGGVLILSRACMMGDHCSTQKSSEDKELQLAGGLTILGGLLMIAVGVPVAVWGGQLEPRRQPTMQAMLVPIVTPTQAGTAFAMTF